MVVRVTSSGTATNGTAVGSDYAFTSPTDLTFPAASGSSFSQTVSVSFFEDLTAEGEETAILTLGIQSDGTGGQASVGTPGVHTDHDYRR